MSIKRKIERLEKQATAAEPEQITVKIIYDDAELPAARERAAVDPDFILVELG